jgi:hypothetical protein
MNNKKKIIKQNKINNNLLFCNAPPTCFGLYRPRSEKLLTKKYNYNKQLFKIACAICWVKYRTANTMLCFIQRFIKVHLIYSILLKKEKCKNLSEDTVDTQYIDLTNKSQVIAADTNTDYQRKRRALKSNSKCVQHLRLTSQFANCKSKVLSLLPTATKQSTEGVSGGYYIKVG